jgi:N-acetyl-gamma-glutamyl-phosphate reductase common form
MNEPIEKTPTIVLGASGYVAGEMFRLLSAHPRLELTAAISESQAGNTLESVFPHLHSTFGEHAFQSRATLPELLGRASGPLAVFSAASHGASAALVQELLASVNSDTDVHVVDLSADFRYSSAAAYEAVYGSPHGAPELLTEFSSLLPEHFSDTAEPTTRHVGHPGCFASALLLAIVPLLKLGIVEPDIFATGVTGSTGSGREPKPTTHHPLRQSNLFAYAPLTHRHVPEVTAITEQVSGVRPSLHFIPHSGPFARGIHMTVQGKLKTDLDRDAVVRELESFYASSPFVRVVAGTPKLKDVVGSNYADLGVACDGDTVAVFSTLDNLTKGAAGGGVQWMNRLLGFPETEGLTLSGPGWI